MSELRLKILNLRLWIIDQRIRYHRWRRRRWLRRFFTQPAIHTATCPGGCGDRAVWVRVTDGRQIYHTYCSVCGMGTVDLVAAVEALTGERAEEADWGVYVT